MSLTRGQCQELCAAPGGVTVCGWWSSGCNSLYAWLRMSGMTLAQLQAVADRQGTAGVLLFTIHRDDGIMKFYTDAEFAAWDGVSAWPQGGRSVGSFSC
jgi:hypothetical protein